ncbi:MAG: Crp/Fnr family transcriptional regulator [Candidatus Electrothrix sp. YB6]
MTGDKKKVLAGSLLFKGISDELITMLAAIAREKYFLKRQTIFLEGSPSCGFYILAEGQIKIFKTSPDGKEQMIYALGPGEPFGLSPVFHGLNFPATAASMVPSTVLYFPKQEFIALATAHPPLALSMLAGLSQRLCRFAEKIGSLSLKDVPARLIDHLIYLAEQQKRTDLVILDMPKKQLACLLGTTPETLSRIFADMSRTGLIRVNGSTVELLRYEALLQRQ